MAYEREPARHDVGRMRLLLRWRRDADGDGDEDEDADAFVAGPLDDDVIDACAGRDKVEERLPLEQRAMVDFFKSMFERATEL